MKPSLLAAHAGLAGTLALAGLIGTVTASGSVAVAAGPGARPPHPTRMLGLPSLSQAHRYVLAPPTRTVRPHRVATASAVNDDYVSATSPVSETQAHALRVGTSDTTSVDGVEVRRAGGPGGHFSYLLHVHAHHAVGLRVEEAGSSDARYRVQVAGTTLRERHQSLYVAQGRPVGVTHFQLRVPARLVRADTLRVTFRNTDHPGDGARISGVWAQESTGRRLPAPGYGGLVTRPFGAAGHGSTGLSARFFSRPYVVYDFGREVGGRVRLDYDATTGSPRLGLAFSESDTFMTTASDFSQDPSGVATETHYFGLDRRRGAVRDPVIRGGFRYLMVFLDRPGSVRISHLRLHFDADPGRARPDLYAGAFSSSSRLLDRLWYSGAYTTQMSTIASDTGRPYPAQPGPVSNDQTVAAGSVFLSDGAKRDRLDWGGDNAVSDVVSYLTTGRAAPAANSVSWFAAHPSDQGQVPGVYLPQPAGFNDGWGEYAGWWNVNYWNHYLYTGDRAFLTAWFPALVGNVGWFESHVGDDGLWDVPADAGGHWGYGEAGRQTYDNLVYVTSLRAAARAATAMDRPELARAWRAAADRTAAALDDPANGLWDDETGAYREIAGSSAHPLDANALAVASGVAGPDRTRRVLAFVREHLATPKGDLAVDVSEGSAVPRYISPFVGAQELTAYAEAGDPAGALDLLRRTWRHMLDGPNSTGTFWETVGPDGGLGLGAYTSMSHGWAAAPTSFLTERTLGVQPTTAGYATFAVAPQPLPGLRWAQGRVPTPHGPIRTAWRRTANGFRLLVQAPPGTSYTAQVPVVGAVTVDGSPARSPRARAGEVPSRLRGLRGSHTITVTTIRKQG